MPQLTFQIQSKVDVNQILSASDLKKLFFAGLPLDKLDQLSDEMIDFYINAASNFIEQEITVKLNKTIIIENKDFSQDDWRHWGYIQATYPAVVGVALFGNLGNVRQVTYPDSWMSCRKTNDDALYSRQIYMVPATNSTQSQLIVYNGMIPNAGMFANRIIPNYWEVSYVTGFDKVPPAIVQAIGMTAAIQILLTINDLIVKGNKNYPGIGFGVSSNSISLDGLSQNSGTYQNGTTGIFSAKIKLYQDQLLNPERGLLQSLRDYYGGILMGGC